jgi:transposase InsO family protein
VFQFRATWPGKKRHSSSAPAEIAAAPNALKQFAVFRDEHRAQAGQTYAAMTKSGAWVQDFTHLRFMNEEHYLAVVLDLQTRQVVGWRLGTKHGSELTLAAVLDALSKAPRVVSADGDNAQLQQTSQSLADGFMEPLSNLKPADEAHELAWTHARL